MAGRNNDRMKRATPSYQALAIRRARKEGTREGETKHEHGTAVELAWMSASAKQSHLCSLSSHTLAQVTPNLPTRKHSHLALDLA